MKSWAVIPLTLLAALGSSDQVRPLGPHQLTGIRLWSQDDFQFRDAGNGRDVVFTCRPRFKNETNLELACVSVRLVVDQDGHRVYTSAPQSITRFENFCVPHSGSLLPLEKSDIGMPVRFQFASELWNTHSWPHLEFVGASRFVGGDLHDPGHLFTYFANTHDDQVIAKLKQDPSLARIVNSRGMSATLMAFAACGTPVIKYLLAHGGSLKPSAGGTTPMHMASVNPNPGVQDLALKLGGNVNARTQRGMGNPPISKSIAIGLRQCWQWLLAHGADPDCPDVRGLPPVYTAIFEGQALAIQDLAKAGAHLTRHDRFGTACMEYATTNPVMYDTLASLRISVNDPDPRTGRTPLMYAASTGIEEAELWLLRHGANLAAKDKHGRTAYDYSRHSNTFTPTGSSSEWWPRRGANLRPNDLNDSTT